ncbi:ECF-type sigma factor [Blastopirellula sp. J2-11]|uniref:ECF-type sigma factor n=1 Tax=Blastopirellula sp. J2-11 TaxID=2943192 RepID=UPI0021C74478|nr:ECF-type sigma factor [Blastopirellula sp. J2-11]UUO04967.1 ECF-type sigma factor [Blastopirellula sp. J2-11]
MPYILTLHSRSEENTKVSLCVALEGLEMPDSQSVSDWLRNLEDGDAEAAQNLWDRYFQSLMHQAEKRIGNVIGGKVEAEDIAVSVFESLFDGARKGRFESVQNRDELWWLLLAMTQRKVVSAVRHETADKRGGKNSKISIHQEGNCNYFALVSREPGPEEAIALDDEFKRAIDILPSPMLQRIATMTIEGKTTSEISEELGIATATVIRKRSVIRQAWQRELSR